jgi:hypothetical protein
MLEATLLGLEVSVASVEVEDNGQSKNNMTAPNLI